MKIAHLITDDKFPDSAYDMFESIKPGCNYFILPNKRTPIKNLKKINPIRVSKFSFLDRRFISWINSFDALIVHGMYSFSLELINRCRSDLKIYWIGMGFDYYDIVYSSKWEMIKKATKSKIYCSQPSVSLKDMKMVKVLKDLRNSLIYPKSKNKKKWVERVDYFCPVLESEFYLVKENIEAWKAAYIDWNYGNSADLVDGRFGYSFSLGNNILVGNSASPNNNHIDAFHFLQSNITFLDRTSKIIVPLSYGDSTYRNTVIKEGENIFGERFVPLTIMVPPEEYRRVIESCSIVYMNHLRQQAGNNIAQALFIGSRVILDEKNPFFNDYKKHGVYLNSLDEVKADPELFTKPLSFEEKSSNQNILKRLRGSATSLQKTQAIIQSI